MVCQKDSEGNGYSTLSGVDFNVMYLAENAWSGEQKIRIDYQQFLKVAEAAKILMHQMYIEKEEMAMATGSKNSEQEHGALDTVVKKTYF